jgi:hypothetical protein
MDAPQEEEMKVPEESRVGKKLSDLTTRRVILLVLAMMFSVPAFTITTYKDENNSFVFGLELINAFTKDTAGFVAAYNSYKEEHIAIRTPLILLTAFDDTAYDYLAVSVNPNDLRSAEKEVVTIDNGNFVAIFDLRANT